MTENKQSKMNLEHERKIATLQERIDKLENICYAAKEVLNLEEAADFLGRCQKHPLQDDTPEPVAIFQACRETDFLREESPA